jgi:sugar transferase (PEP-CTERM/EpsH1 system associated)
MAQYVEGENEIPIIVDLVDVDSDKWLHYARVSRLPMSSIYRREGRLLREYERRLCERASSTLLTTEREAQLMREICSGARVQVIPNGVDTDYFKAVAKRDRSAAPAIVFTGDMSYFPNAEAVTYFAHKVFPAIRKSIAHVRFLIVGRDPTSKVRRLQRLEGVEVTGLVPDVRPYLEKAQVSVAPFSISAGIPNKILEAMAFGLPVVGTSCAVQGLSAYVAAVIDIAATPEEFASKTVRLLRNAELAASIGIEGRRRVITEHDWGRAMDHLLRVVDEPESTGEASTANTVPTRARIEKGT